MLLRTGVASRDDLASVLPAEELRARKGVAVIECFQEIPCDPCAHACRVGAITPFDDINSRPRVEHDKCTGCGVCMSQCPGLAIFLVHEHYSETEALVTIPYEYLPVPSAGDTVEGLDREGTSVCRARVLNVRETAAQDRTLLISLVVPRDMAHVVRNIKVEA